jgi:hypothetical protein
MTIKYRHTIACDGNWNSLMDNAGFWIPLEISKNFAGFSLDLILLSCDVRNDIVKDIEA